MNKRRLKKLVQEMRSLRNRAGSITERDLIGIAKKLGRTKFKRGDHPTYISIPFHDLKPVTIPSHRTMNRHTALAILDDLDNDVFRWREELRKSNDPEDKSNG
jgi:hypothetical protein